MPIERNNNVNPSRPLMPTLASSRTAKTPVAPRLAAPINPPIPPSRRSDRSDLSSIPTSATPTNKNLLNSNVTPRSSTRKSRAGSNQSTPNDTPVHSPMSTSRPASGVDYYRRDRGNTSAVPTLATPVPAAGRPRSMGAHAGVAYVRARSRSPHSTLSGIAGSDSGAKDEMFFHADAARPIRAPVPTQVQKKAPAFFYADGQKETTTDGNAGMPSPPLSSVGRANPPPINQFFHANTIPENKVDIPPPVPQQRSISPERAPAIHPKTAAFRSPSPEKLNIHLSYRKGASQIMRPNGHRPSPISMLSSEHLSRRRSSTDSPIVRISHAKSGSLSSIDSLTSPPRATDQKAQTASPTSPKYIELPPPSSVGRLSTESIESITESLTRIEEIPVDTSEPSLPSPTKTVQAGASLAKMNEMAANARRERKVLDLEISNSSLLAINRQLEREVRKQKAELRRYRRLSRAGRFSTSTTRTSIGDFSEYDETESLGRLENVNEDEENEESESSDSESSVDEEALSPSALQAHDAKHMFKDERRLQLDLSKHKELLVDSQKMNQSLKRCLGWTEELIAQGKKALEYKVHVSDVKIGGRILTADDHETHDDAENEEEEDPTIGPGGGLLSPWTPTIEKHKEQIEALLNEYNSTNQNRPDRDSGIELDVPPDEHSKII